MVSLQDYQISDINKNYIFYKNLCTILVSDQCETSQADHSKLQNDYNISSTVDSKTIVTGLYSWTLAGKT